MSHTESWQKFSASYPFIYELDTRFQDVDMLGHINNVAMAGLFEAGRVRFNMGYDGVWRKKGRRVLIASLTVNYLAESYYPEPMQICCGISRIGNTSWQIAQAAFQYRRLATDESRPADELPVCVAAGFATMVLSGKEGSIVLPDELRAALRALSVVKTQSI